MTMNPKQYREAVEQLFRQEFTANDRGLSRVAEFCGVNASTSHRWATGARPVPLAVAKLLRLMIERDIKPEDVL